MTIKGDKIRGLKAGQSLVSVKKLTDEIMTTTEVEKKAHDILFMRAKNRNIGKRK